MSSSTSSEDHSSSAVELLVLTLNECFVYKVPPLRTASGHRAEDWDLANPIFTGCLKVYQADSKLRIIIFTYKDPANSSTDDNNLITFGACPIEVKPGGNVIGFVDGVIDSSRYYVIKIKDPNSTRTTSIGIGFRERDNSFDFKNTLNEYVRFVNRMDLAEKMKAEANEDSATDTASTSSNRSSEDGSSPSPAMTASHFSKHIEPLKEGEKIKISVKKLTPTLNDLSFYDKPVKHHLSGSGDDDDLSFISPVRTTRTPSFERNSPSVGGFHLKPPPPPGSTVHYTGPGGPVGHATSHAVAPPIAVSPAPAAPSPGSSPSGSGSPTHSRMRKGSFTQQQMQHHLAGSAATAAATLSATLGNSIVGVSSGEDDDDWGEFSGPPVVGPSHSPSTIPPVDTHRSSSPSSPKTTS